MGFQNDQPRQQAVDIKYHPVEAMGLLYIVKRQNKKAPGWCLSALG